MGAKTFSINGPPVFETFISQLNFIPQSEMQIQPYIIKLIPFAASKNYLSNDISVNLFKSMVKPSPGYSSNALSLLLNRYQHVLLLFYLIIYVR